jgi:hypothetical protein
LSCEVVYCEKPTSGESISWYFAELANIDSQRVRRHVEVLEHRSPVA